MHSGEPDPIFAASRRPRKGPGKLAASKIKVTEAAVGELGGLDGVESDGVAETVGVAGDAA